MRRAGALRQVAALAGKDLRDVLREKTIVVALVVQLFVAGFSTFLAVGLSSLYDPSTIDARTRADVAYAGPGGFDSVLAQARNLRVQRLDAAAALDSFHSGGVDAVIQESGNATGVRTVTVLLEEGGIQSTLLLTQVKGLLEAYERQLRTARQDRLDQQVLAVELPRGDPPPFAFVYATLLPLLVFTPVVLSGAIAGDAVAQEAQSRTLTLLRCAPLSTGRILAGKLVVPLALAPLQVLLWLGLLALNGLPVADPLGLLVLALACTLVLAGASVALAAGLRREGAVQAGYALVAIVLGGASLLLPRDPLRLAAALGTGSAGAQDWLTVGALAAAGCAVAALGSAWAAARLRRST